MTINDIILDASARHSVFLTRYSGGTARRIIELLNAADEDLTALLGARLAAA